MRPPTFCTPPSSRRRAPVRALPALALAVATALSLPAPATAMPGAAPATSAPATSAPATSAPGTGVPTASTVPATAAGVPREAHVENPYRGARGYVNPEWRKLAEAEPGGRRVSRTPTAVWLDQVSDVTGTAGTMGLRAHLDAALAQRATLVQVVLDDLPGRDCARWVTSGDFAPGERARYEHEYVDPIVAIESDPRYGRLRIVNVVERNALAELIVNRNLAPCSEARTGDDYVGGVQYALDALHRYSNLYTYLGLGGHGWLGWDVEGSAALDLFTRTARGTAAGPASVDGFVSNLTGYAALTEPFLDPKKTVGGTPIRQSRWVDWNLYADELSFVTAFRARLVAAGFPARTGMVVDTSRNGWGGPDRPTQASTSTDVDTYVDASRVDRRLQSVNWCNQVGAGLGERPQADPAPGVQAYAWLTPPGVSDGSSTFGTPDADPAADPMCGPGNPRYSGVLARPGAMPDAPPRGSWFPAAFRQLLANAYPPLP